jgi:formyltetrahydrofolate-dependent phosphoribosylglycinamide formyltransferase
MPAESPPVLRFPLSPLRLAVLVSGGGTTLANLLREIEAGRLDAVVRLVVSSNPDAAGLGIAAGAGIPTFVAERSAFAARAEFSRAVFDRCRQADCHLAAMGGFLKQVDIPPDFIGRVMNVHPALIPSFCGRGFYGRRVHAAALEYGVKLSGCTVHFVDDEYDHGPIVLQRTVPVADDDTPEALAARVFAAECEAYPAALRLFAAGRLRIDGRRVRGSPE